MTKPDNAAPEVAGAHEHTVVVTVNNQPVTVPAPKATGRQIKEAAIAAGLPIQVDFVLSQVLPNDKTKIIGDNDEVTVNKNSTFTAVAPDDNS
jgi:hypothetical protein